MLRQLLILSLLVIIFIIWLAFHLKEVNVIPVLITLGNTYGLLLVALLLGYGLIAFPRSLWRRALPEHELRKVYLMVVKADDELYEAVWSLQDVEYAIDSAVAKIVDLDEESSSDLFYKYCVNELLHGKNLTAELSPELNMRRTTNRRNAEDEDGIGNGNGNNGVDDSFARVRGDKPPLQELVKLNRKLKRAQENLFNAHQKWNGLLEKHLFFTGMDPDLGMNVNMNMNMSITADGHPRNDGSSASTRAPLPLSPKNEIYLDTILAISCVQAGGDSCCHTFCSYLME